MKPIKLTKANADRIEMLLSEVNGRSQTHCYTTIYDLLRVEDEADEALKRLRLPKKSHIGASYTSTSGEAVASAYKGLTRNATTVDLFRRRTGWFITGICATQIWRDGGWRTLTLTEEQDAEAVRRFRSAYLVVTKQNKPEKAA